MSQNYLKHIPAALWLTIWLIFAICIWFVLYPYQLTRGCWLGEWPFEQGCDASKPTGFLTKDPETVFVDHLRKNPGHSSVYSWLALHRWNNQDPNAQKSLRVALHLDPLESQVLRVHANDSLSRRDWLEASQSLIKMIESGNEIANLPLLSLLSNDDSQSIVINQITKDSVWLDKLLQKDGLKFSVGKLLPVFNHGKRLGLISAGTTLFFIDRLQAAGQWLDAYALWVNYQGSLTEGLFNGGFDSRISQKAFDWKWLQSKDNQKAMLARQTSAYPNHGMLLELELVGRSALPLPLISQNVMLFGDEYQFRGQYRTHNMQLNDGLSWKFSCAAGGEPWAQTEALQDTQKQWARFDLKFKIPTTCGAAILVGLETNNRGEARLGGRGIVQFDGLSISSVK